MVRFLGFGYLALNGMLGKFPNNQKHIEIQLMRRFETEMQLYALSAQSSKEPLFDILKSISVGSDEYQMIHGHGHFGYYQLSSCSLQEVGDSVMLLFQNSGTWKFPSRWTVHSLNMSELVAISQALRHVFVAPNFIPEIASLSKLLRCYKRIDFRSEVFSIYNDSRYGRHSHILARWAGEDGDIDTSFLRELRPGRIQLIPVQIHYR